MNILIFNITPLSTLYNSLILKGLKFNNFLAKNCKPSIYRALEKRVESQVNDIEFIVPETSILVSNIFHITPSTSYTNRPYMEPAVGMSICKYGAVTGQSCGSIVKTDLKAYGQDACPANTANGVMGACSDTFVLVEGPINSLKSVNGDSGGPVFERSTGSPLGIHSASFDKDATTKAVVFSKLKYMSELGVTLKQ
nr:trypsin-like serine protease [Enhydrobacter sp. 8BJ]